MGLKLQYKILTCFIGLMIVCSTYPDASIRSTALLRPTANFEGEPWVDSIFQRLTLDQKIGQLFMIRAHSDLGEDHVNEVIRQIKNYQVGGLCFFQGTPQKQIELTNRYQAINPSLPLMIAMDAEWGPGMRLKTDVLQLPKQLTLGAIQDNTLMYEYGSTVARHLKRLGVHINFAPDVDINNNPNNPVINDRSFGEDKYNVATKSFMYMSGLQENGIMACAKHFPGHGDTDVDSHLDLPTINHSLNRLNDIELFPFKLLIQNGLQSCMSGHLNVPSLDASPNMPISLSRPVITDLLRNELGFDGIIFTDAMEMKGVLKYNPPGIAELKALQAGNDIVLLPIDIKKAFETIKKAIAMGELNLEQVNASVKRVLKAKYKMGLKNPPALLDNTNLDKDLRDHKAQAFKEKLYQKAVTLVRDQQVLIPLIGKKNTNIAVLGIGANDPTEVSSMLELHFPVDKIQISKECFDLEKTRIKDRIDKADIVIIELHGMSRSASKDFGISKSALQYINQLQATKQVILTIFGNPYSLKFFQNIQTILLAYEDDPDAHKAIGQALLGLKPISGRLPVSVNGFELYSGIHLIPQNRLGYDHPLNRFMDPHLLKKVDELAKDIIQIHAAPGCQILIAKDGDIIYDKTFGYYTYDNIKPVTKKSIYDIASMTKILSTTLAMMKLQEDGSISIDKPLSDYLTELKGTNKEFMTIKDIMAHIAGLQAWIPFYKNTLQNNLGIKKYSDSLYRKVRSDSFNIEVTESLFINSEYKREVMRQIINSEVSPSKRYRYSDLGFYLLAELVERLRGVPLDKFVKSEFYDKLGLISTLYRPLTIYDKSEIVPSEQDDYFRFQKIQGTVHDMGAAIIGGVSGHAGLFSNAYEVAVIGQMLLQNGNYGGIQLLKPETVALFTHRHPDDTRRAIGFDMSQQDGSKKFNMSRNASPETFGHTGFTGTCIWIDPKYQLVYVFLSNRTYPSMENNLMNNKDYRDRIQSAIYDAIISH
ncbi:MAG: serine hydrolase [Saprospiraceae bacterium]|nr:serine hydrolase [Saprospiraceae bacterium]